MKTLIMIGSVVGMIITLPLTAAASIDSCTESLLNTPVQHSQAQLGLSAWQAGRLAAIQRDTGARGSQLQAQLAQVQQELDQQRGVAHDPVAMMRLEQEQVALASRLETIQSRGASQALMLLNTWQRQRCEGYVPPRIAAVFHPTPPPPRVVVVRNPRPRVVKQARVIKQARRNIRPAPRKQVHHRPQQRPRQPAAVHRAPPAPRPAHSPAAKPHQPRRPRR